MMDSNIMSFSSSVVLLILLSLSADHGVLGCYKRQNSLKKSDCAKFPKSSVGCKRVFLGKRQCEDLALDLYRVAAKLSSDPKAELDQENMLLVPLETSRVISAIVHATEEEKKKSKKKDEESVDQMRCYVSTASKRLRQSVLVGSNEDKRKVEQRQKNASDDAMPPRMLVMDRHIFVDDTLRASENYTKEAVCWYEMEMSGVNFKTGGARAVNAWAAEKHRRALDLISDMKKEDPARQAMKPLAGDPKNVGHALAVITSSIYLKVAWRKGLFSAGRVKKAEPFLVGEVRGGGGGGKERTIKIPMMTTKAGQFKYAETPTYSSISLPLADGARNAFVVFVLPQKESNLTEVEHEVFGSGNNMRSFMGTMRAAGEHRLRATVPRLTVQVTHEWGAPKNRSMRQIVAAEDNEGENGGGGKNKALSGGAVGVYQDTFLEMIENKAGEKSASSLSPSSLQTGSSSKAPAGNSNDNDEDEDDEEETQDSSSSQNSSNNSSGKVNKTTVEFVLNRPFLFVMSVDRDVVALGRITNPAWCKFCEGSKHGGNHSSPSTNATSVEKGEGGKEDQQSSRSFFQKVKDFFG